jgi:hypothetical protein
MNRPDLRIGITIASLPKRRTSRAPFKEEPIDPQVKTDWLHDAAEHRCWLGMTEDKEEQHEIADLIG